MARFLLLDNEGSKGVRHDKETSLLIAFLATVMYNYYPCLFMVTVIYENY